MLKQLSVYGYYIGLLGMLVGASLSSKILRNALTEVWLYSQGRIESDKSAKQLGINAVYKTLLSLYKKNGKISFRRVLLIAVVLNLLYYYPLLVLVKPKLTNPNEYYWVFMLVLILTLCAVAFLYELVSSVFTIYFYKKASEKCSFRYIFFDVLFLIIFNYLLPIIPIMFWKNEFSIFVLGTSPGIPLWLVPLYFRDVFDAHYLAFTVPAGLSVCLPSVLALTLLIIVNVNWLMRIVAFTIEFVTRTGAKTIVAASASILGVASAVYTFQV